MTDKTKYQTETWAIRGGIDRSDQGEHSELMYLTSSYLFKSAEQAATRFSGEDGGNVYSRYTNPTVKAFEERLALMEQSDACVATSSGMAAILSTCMALLQAGDHIVCSRDVFGSTTVLLNKFLAKMGVETTYVGLTDLDDWKAACQDNTKLFFLESPSNPLCEVADIPALSKLAKSNNAYLVVDNCFATPILQKPLLLGADIVIHSATKYIDGQGRCLGGAVLGRKEDMEEVLGFLRSGGPCMSPFNAWVFLKGLETLSVRMRAHCENAENLAAWLKQHPAVEHVFYAGLSGHRGHDLASKQMSAYGGVLSFRVKGGRKEAWKVIDSTQLISHTANLGDAKTTIVHPATTTHGRIADHERAAAGITENLIRVAVGLEHIEDIKADLALGLDQL
jgi:O-succinylhomoserine sulfhydrylase|tara:strand:- start:41547 stop:42728 length:1182 start_codon:yes stop_codon:yes gene_type:complete